MNTALIEDGQQPVRVLTPQALWLEALEHLRLLIPAATYRTLFADSTGSLGAEGTLVVVVSTPQAKAWIETRLHATVENALRAAGYSGGVAFRLGTASPAGAEEPAGSALPPTPERAPSAGSLPTPGPTHLKPGDVALTFLNFDLYARGWLRTPSYYELFWQPVLGYTAYAFWRLMQALYWRDSSAGFTRRVRLDIQDSAAHLGVSRDLIRGKPVKGLGGALKALSDQGLAEVDRHEAGRATVYSARFRRSLPLLAPRQVAQLTPSQQEQHLDWLLAAGYDPASWEALGSHLTTLTRPEEAAVHPVELEPYVNPNWEGGRLSQTGFLRTPVYYDLFLQPLIGPAAYAIWRVCKCLNWSDTQQLYTQDTVTSVYALAATLGCNRQKITGVKRRQNGVAYWQEGAFDRLRQERLALIREEGSGSQVAYRLLVVNEPPLLCPSQVDKLAARLQEIHRDWLDKARLELEEWRQLSMDSLLTLVEPCAVEG
jgi:hypothetical protein